MQRSAIVLVLLVAASPARAQPPLLSLEARVSGGALVGGGAGTLVTRYAPLTIGADVEVAVIAQPWVSLYGGAYVETLDRAGVGLMGGARIRLLDGKLRLGAGALGTIAPYTIGGVLGTAGGCLPLGKAKRVRLCGDVEIDLFFLGDDLPPSRVASQFLGVIGAVFDVL